MSSKIVKEQLKRVVFANLSNYDEATNTYYIKKYSKPCYKVGEGYLIQIPKYLINNPTSVVAVN